jgi:phosphoribosylaminoimidazole-succinocarboxamide synthase (EC 6.3.2.6)
MFGGALSMEKKNLCYEGKAKKVFTTDHEDVYIVQYKDDATAFNGLKKGIIKDKGIVNNRMSNYMLNFWKAMGLRLIILKNLMKGKLQSAKWILYL